MDPVDELKFNLTYNIVQTFGERDVTSYFQNTGNFPEDLLKKLGNLSSQLQIYGAQTEIVQKGTISLMQEFIRPAEADASPVLQQAGADARAAWGGPQPSGKRKRDAGAAAAAASVPSPARRGAEESKSQAPVAASASSPAKRVPPGAVALPPGFLTTDQIIEMISNRLNPMSPDDSIGAKSPNPQLPPPEPVNQSTRFLIYSSNPNLTEQNLLENYSDNVDPIIEKSFLGNYRSKRSFVKDLPDSGQYDIIFVIDTSANLQTLPFDHLYNLLKMSGYLVLMDIHENDPDRVTLDQIFKYTKFIALSDAPRILNLYFMYFNAGHIFYMKRQLKGDAMSPSLVSPLFATFSYNKNTRSAEEVLFNVKNEVFKVELAQERFIIVPVHGAAQGYLPLNYVSNRGFAAGLQTVLSQNWYKIEDCYGDLSRTNRPDLAHFIRRLDSYFRTIQVRGGGNCMFLALNALFALKAMPLLDLRTLLDGINNFLLQLNQNGFQNWFYIKPLDNSLPMTLLEVQSDLIQDYFDPNNRSLTWLNLLSHILKIRIVLFDISSAMEPIKNFAYVPQLSVDSEDQVPLSELPTFFLFLNRGHYYPLFPVRDLPFDPHTKKFSIFR